MDKRLLYRVIIKLLFLVVIAILGVVFINSLFTGVNTKNGSTQADNPTGPIIVVDLARLEKGKALSVRWKGKEVSILRRKKSLPLHNAKYVAKIPHTSLNSGLRSLTPDYFVYMNHGDSNNCPLFVEADGLKDVCTSTKFDTTGRAKGNEQQGFHLKIPPHHFNLFSDNPSTVTIGTWEEVK